MRSTGVVVATAALLALAGCTAVVNPSSSGAPWTDVDHNGCDTRDDILTRDLAGARYDPGCVVDSGILHDPCTGRSIAFQRAGDLVDIDHVVALGDAWVTGASTWDAGERVRFANDPANLLAVDASSNRQKGDGDAATWLPSNKAFRCGYAARQVGVKHEYALWSPPPSGTPWLGCSPVSRPPGTEQVARAPERLAGSGRRADGEVGALRELRRGTRRRRGAREARGCRLLPPAGPRG